MMFFRLILREFKAQRMRMALTIGAVIWGTVAITLLLAFGEGLKKQMIKATRGLGNHIVILYGGQTTIPYQGLPQGRRIRFTMDDMELLRKAFPEIKSITAEYNAWSAALGYDGKEYSKLCSGVTPEFGPMRSQIAEAGGRFINEPDEKFKRRTMFVGDKLAKDIFGEENAVGKQVTFNGIPFTIVGVMRHKLQNSSYSGPDDDKVTIPASTYQTIFNDRYVQRLIYQVHDGVDTKALESRVTAYFSNKFRYDPKDKRAMRFWDVGEEERITNMVFIGITGFMFFIGAMTLLISGVGIANIMYVAVRERTREIGTKIALGGERKHIVIQFLTESLTISLVGGTLGIFLCMGIVRLMGMLPAEGSMELFGQPRITWIWTLSTVAILTIIGFFAGYFPARKAALVNPVEALRYE
jgi:putative ABC transport system permease protein